MAAIVVGVVLVLSAAGVARAAAVHGGSTPLAGSMFQGGDGNQDDELVGQVPYVDWQGFQAAGRVVHSPDPNAADSAFVGGRKEDKPGSWALTTEAGGVTPAKANILDAWSAVDQRGANTFVYLGFTRQSDTGFIRPANADTFLAFELNQDPRLWNNGRAEIPCRRDGDVLVVFAAHGNGIDIDLEQWTTLVADPSTGCASRGQLASVASIPADTAQGDVNTRAITSRLPGFYAPSSTISESRFGEAALNLSALLQMAFNERCLAFASMWMHSRASESESSNMQDYVAPRAVAVRTCSASGTKFSDLDADGRFDAGEPGLPGFLIWADYDNDGVRDPNEPFTETDAQGDYVLKEIEPPAGTDAYTLRETLVSRAARRASDTAWRCSYPSVDTPPDGFADGVGGLFGCGWGPIAASTPFARGRDFGNWLPAQLTVEKQLWPNRDRGRFGLEVNDVTVFPMAGDGDFWTSDELRPGTYGVTETAAPGTNADDYTSTVTCQVNAQGRGRRRAGTAYPPIVLKATDRATCTFINVRKGAPAIALEKDGPLVATAGDTLHYTLYVTNPGDVPLPASTVHVSDDTCDQPPELVSTADRNGKDDTPESLNPGDTWTYECSHKTQAPTADCTVSTVTNTATATGSANGTTVERQDEHTTTLNCPEQPPEPPLPTPRPPNPTPTPTPAPNPGPTPPAPVVAAGATPPPAGRIGVAGLRVGRGCVASVSQVRLLGTHVSLIRVSVDGRLVKRERLQILQRSATPLPRLFGPGPHRLTVRVRFERGSASPPVTLTRTITICAALRRQPTFTG